MARDDTFNMITKNLREIPFISVKRTETIYVDGCTLIDYYIQVIDALKELVTSLFFFSSLIYL